MVRLGYDRFVAQGGDWGSLITTLIGAQDLGHCAGIHINMPVAFPSPDDLGDLTEEEIGFLGRLQAYRAQEAGYSTQQSTRPQTLGDGLADFSAGAPTVSIPAGVSQFKNEIFAASRRWADGVYTDIRHWNQLDRGGHFAAFEEPDLFVDEVRASFRHAR